MKARVRRWPLWVAAVLVPALVLVTVVLFLPGFFRLGLRAANAFLPVRVEVGGYRHLPGDLTLGEVLVSSPRGPICSIRTLRAEYGFLRLFLGRIRVRALEVEGVRMRIQRYPDGGFSLSGLRAGAAGPRSGEAFRPEALLTWASLPLVVERLEVSDAAAEYADAAAGVTVAAEGLRVTGALNTRPLRARLHGEGGHLRIRKQGQEGELHMEVEGTARVRGDILELAGLQLRSDPGVLEVSGSWDLKGNRLAMTADLREVPLDRTLAAWGIPGIPVSGLSGRIEVGSESFRDSTVNAALQATAYGHAVRADLMGAMAGGVVHVDSLTVTDAEASLAGEGSLDIAAGAVTATARLEASVLEEAFRVHGWPGTRLEDVRLEAEIGGTLQDPDIRAVLSLRQGSARGERLFAGLHAEGSYDRQAGARLSGTADGSPFLPGGAPGGLSFSAGYADGLIHGAVDTGPALRLKGAFQLDTRLADVSFTARRLQLTGPARLWVPDLSTASLSGTGRFQGDVEDRESWHGEAKIEEFSLSAPALRLVASRAANVRLLDGGVQVDLAARVNGEPLDLRGTLPIVPGGTIQIRGRAALSLAPFQGFIASRVPWLQACEGNLDVLGQVQGTLRSPVIRASASLRDGWVVVAPETGGDAGNGGPPPPAAFQGRLWASADLQGPLRTLEGALRLQATGAALYGFPVEEVWLEVAGNGSRWRTERALVRTQHGSLSVEGDWNPQTDRISGLVHSTDWSLGGLFSSRGIPVDGQARLEGTILGELRSPRVRLTVPVRALTLKGRPYGDVEGTLDLDPGRLSTRWRLASGEVEGIINLKGGWGTSLRASLQDFLLDPLLETWQRQGWEGRVSLDGSLEGSLADLSRWSGQVTLSRLDLSTADVPVRLAKPVLLSFSPGEVSIPGAELLFHESSLRLRGTLGRENRFSATGSVELAPFAADLLPWVKLEQGTALLDLQVAGTILAPDVRGSVKVDARDLSFPSFPFPVERLTAEVTTAAGGAVEVRSLLARVGDGSLTARGNLTLNPFYVKGLDLVLASLPVSLSDSFSGVVRGTLRFEGSEASSLFQGAVRIEHARYEQDFDLLGTVLSPRRPRLRVERVPPAFLQNMQLDIRVRSGPDLYVRNNIARMILSTDVNIRGTAEAVAPAGRIKVLQGDVYFNNRDFKITRGTLVFLGMPDTYPTLQLDSRANVEGKYRDYLALLSMNGPLDRIDLTLSSIPALSKEDILFVLFTGMTQEEYFATPTDVKGAGAGLVASGFSALVGKDVKTWSGLDTFELGGYDREGIGMKATLGKRIGERMEVKGTASVGEQLQRGEAQVEYELADGFYLVGTQRTDGSFGLDLRFRFVGR